MGKARTICHAPTCSRLQPCPVHLRKANDHHGVSRQDRGLGADHERMRVRVLREEHSCGLCGGLGLPDDVADHKLARARGGTNERENYQRAHRKCNAMKGIGA